MQLQDAKEEPELVIEIDEDDTEGETIDEMPEFFEEVGNIKTLISLLRGNIKSIQNFHKNDDQDESQGKTRELESLLETTNTAASQIRTRLNKMKQENETLAPGTQKKTRSNLYSTLLKKFLEIREDYTLAQRNYQNHYREKIKQQAQIIKPTITKEEVDGVMQGLTGVVADQNLADDQVKAKNALLTIQEQQRDFHHLEKGFQELDILFKELSANVDSSFEDSSKVESDMTHSVHYDHQKIKDVSKSDEYTANRRRRIIALTASVLALTMVVILIVGTTVLNSLDISF
eukprot:TRINITY_DN11491_c0_g1_i1.p1 TRINITY_DN11491_c0_g1~~TRINITY_DN11491_c0_g1_i1.p1  ORF type:complete len:296 (-),score=81.54 TRINITY_DN11491_c0_g1_i1:54-920(-)